MSQDLQGGGRSAHVDRMLPVTECAAVSPQPKGQTRAAAAAARGFIAADSRAQENGLGAGALRLGRKK